MGILFQGQSYYDDRLFVTHLCQGTVDFNNRESHVTITIYHENPPSGSQWCIMTYRNYANYPIFSVKDFLKKEWAIIYMKAVEPTTPLISLNGHPPKEPLPYEDYLEWKKNNHFDEYDYKRVFAAGGSNPCEIIIKTKEQYFKSI